MLKELAGIEPKVITGEFDGFHREAVGYASYRRDVSCYTNFRRVFGDRGRRFDAAIPLLFADYADLHSFATGHTFGNLPHVWNDPAGPSVTARRSGSSPTQENTISAPAAAAAGVSASRPPCFAAQASAFARVRL